MASSFKENKQLERLLKLIQKDKSILNQLNVNELETLNNYLTNKENHLNEIKGEI